jgi:hypothetical protein
MMHNTTSLVTLTDFFQYLVISLRTTPINETPETNALFGNAVLIFVSIPIPFCIRWIIVLSSTTGFNNDTASIEGRAFVVMKI